MITEETIGAEFHEGWNLHYFRITPEGRGRPNRDGLARRGRGRQSSVRRLQPLVQAPIYDDNTAENGAMIVRLRGMIMAALNEYNS